jgi:hypothetical protein
MRDDPFNVYPSLQLIIANSPYVVPFGMNVAASDTNGLPQSENTI